MVEIIKKDAITPDPEDWIARTDEQRKPKRTLSNTRRLVAAGVATLGLGVGSVEVSGMAAEPGQPTVLTPNHADVPDIQNTPEIPSNPQQPTEATPPRLN
jgi:hypothetical protein